MLRASVAVLFSVSALPLVRSHDLWLAPKKSPCRIGEATELLAISGMQFPASENLMAADRVANWAMRGPDGLDTAIWESGEEGKSRCFRRTLEKPGAHSIGFATKPKRIKMTAKEFNEYLAHDGLPHVIESRKAWGIEGRDEEEQYSKFAKAIVQVGDAIDEKAPEPIGLRLEIVPEKNPLLAKEGEELSVRVLYEGKPLAGFLLQMGWEGMGEKPRLEARTDREGRAKIRIPARGLVFLRGIHMREIEGQSYRYESFWASLTFRLP